ncbi:uncharacterized protein LOC133904568 [Phragmites australis]|uniref:uncharacterized protein LOC133904568 n=1 Tax=Phragmites australis TaxID=29695 RepID=UPI002D77A59A|nr:uncharacterized protein LOC133904568 [Phragmites australis]
MVETPELRRRSRRQAPVPILLIRSSPQNTQVGCFGVALFGAGTGIGLGRTTPPPSRLSPILSALEDSPADIVEHFDSQIPGGSVQMPNYSMDSSSRRRRILDQSSSVRRSFEVSGPKPVPVAAPATITNGKDSPPPPQSGAWSSTTSTTPKTCSTIIGSAPILLSKISPRRSRVGGGRPGSSGASSTVGTASSSCQSKLGAKYSGLTKWLGPGSNWSIRKCMASERYGSVFWVYKMVRVWKKQVLYQEEEYFLLAHVLVYLCD